MRKNLLNQQSHATLRLQHLFVLFAMLLTSVGTRAEDYDLTVCGVQVTSENASNVLSTPETQSPTVVFNAQTNTLTLNNAELLGGIVSGLDYLSVHLKESSWVKGESSFSPLETGILSTNSDATLTFTSDVDQESSDPSGFLFFENYTVTKPIDGFATCSYQNHLDFGYNDGIRCVGLVNYFYIGNYVINSKKLTIGQDISYNPETHTLSLNDVTINSDIQSNVYEYVTIEISGSNVVNGSILGTSREKLHVKKAVGATTATLQITNEAESYRPVWDFTECTWSDGLYMNPYAHNLSNDEYEYTLLSGVFYEDVLVEGAYTNEIHYYFIHPTATVDRVTFSTEQAEATPSIWIGSREVNSDGTFGTGQNVLNGVSFMDNVLTANGVRLEDDIVSSLPQLTIKLNDSNDFPRIISTNPDATLTIAKHEEAQAASLRLYAGGTPVISGFASVTLNGMYTQSGDACEYDATLKKYVSLLDKRDIVELKITDVPTYPLWIAGTQVTAGNASDVFGVDYASVSYNDNTKTLTLNACSSPDRDYGDGKLPFITIGSGNALTVHFVGYSDVGMVYDPLVYAMNACTVTFTTDASVPGKLVFNALEQNKISNDNVTTVLGTEGMTKTTDDYGYTTFAVTGTGDITYFGHNLFYPDSSPLANDGYPCFAYTDNDNNQYWYFSNAETTGDNTYFPPTVISIDGTSKMRSAGEDYFKKLTLQYLPLSGDAPITVALKSLDTDKDITYASGTLTDGHVTLIPNDTVRYNYAYLEFTSTADFSFIPLAVKTEYYEPYGITVANIPVTELNASDVLDDGKVSFDVETNTLTLNEISYSPVENIPYVESNLDNLMVKLIGSSSIYTNDIMPTAAFVSTNSNAVLTFTTDESTLLQLLSSNTIPLTSGFKEVRTTGTLYQDGNMIKNLLAPSPCLESGDSDDFLGISRAGYEPDGTTFNYTIEYADGSESQSGTYDMSKSASENNIVLDKPCTVTVYAQYGTVRSAEKVGKLFGFAQSEVSGMPNTTIDMPDIIPAIAETDGIKVVSEGVAVNRELTEIDLTEESYGKRFLKLNLSESDDTPYTVLGHAVRLTVNVVPPAPVIEFDATKTYLDTDVVGISLPEVLADDENATIKYSWSEDCEPGDGNNYTADTGVPLNAGTNTLYAWVRYYDEASEDAVYSARASQVFTVKSDISQLGVKDLIDVESIVYTGSETDPTFTLYDEKTEEDVSAGNYDVRIEKYNTVSQEYDVVQSVVDAGTYMVWAVGKGNTYGGEKLIYECIEVSPADVENSVAIAAIDDQTYSGGQAVTPELTVMFSNIPLVLNTDYTVAYTNNVNAGEATATITGLGNFTGTTSATFNIVNRTLDYTFADGQTWATYYNADEALELPQGIGAFVASGLNVTENTVTVTQIKTIPKQVPVLLKNNTQETTDAVFGEGVNSNLLVHATANVTVNIAEDYIYGLYNDKFMRAIGTIPAGKNYLRIPNASSTGGGQAPQLSIALDGDDGTTGVSQVGRQTGETAGDFYDMQGRKLQQKPSQKGLYIKNGRKVVVK